MLHYSKYPSYLQLPTNRAIKRQSIAINIIATQLYNRFLPNLLNSISKYLLNEHDLTIYIYTDQINEDLKEIDLNVEFVTIQHTPFPLPTLLRHSTLLKNLPQLEKHDYNFHLDADIVFINQIGNELLGDGLTAIEHPSVPFSNMPQVFRNLTYENNKLSKAYIEEQNRVSYYCGAFQGGKTKTYMEAITVISNNIEQDLGQNIIARYHDETHWNRYLVDHPPSVRLPFWYCFPETADPKNRVCPWNSQAVVPDGQLIRMLCFDKDLHGGYSNYRGNALK
ncbi:MAG: glycosyltransferase family protein [Planctomycetota bacterium]|jgi:histo-blood group ABO system transferase